jgi:hypothetical protein
MWFALFFAASACSFRNSTTNSGPNTRYVYGSPGFALPLYAKYNFPSGVFVARFSSAAPSSSGIRSVYAFNNF